MAVSDATVFIVVAQTLTYFALVQNNTRIYRMIGALALILVGMTAGMVEDTAPAFIFAGISIIVGGFRLFEDIVSLLN